MNEKFKGYKITKYRKFTDQRGKLIVFLKKTELQKNDQEFGQIYFVTFDKKGTVRGNHYHHYWKEWFGIVSGKVEVFLVNVKTKKKTHFTLNAKYNQYIRLEIDSYIAHAFRSLTRNAVLLNYANGEWHNKDTYPYQIL